MASLTVGALLATSGGIASQEWSERRSRQREQRERDHGREVWVRGLRYESHAKFSTLFRQLQFKIELHADDPQKYELEEDFIEPLMAALYELELLCTSETAQRAQEALESLSDYQFTNAGARLEETFGFYVKAVRREFGMHD